MGYGSGFVCLVSGLQGERLGFDEGILVTVVGLFGHACNTAVAYK